MRIYAFAEHYPSPYKPYHDTQFAQFVRGGHSLRLFALGRHDGELSRVVRELALGELVQTLPGTLRQLPRSTFSILGRVAQSPAEARRRAAAAARVGPSLKSRLMNAASAVCLPDEAPALCLVHNLVMQAKLQFLSRVYPSALVACWYHGGELAGVPEIQAEVAAAAFASAHVVFTNTQSSRQEALDRGCSPEKIVVTPVGFDLTELPDPGERSYRPDGVLRVLTVGRLSEEKGVAYALAAFARLASQAYPIRYRVVGDGPEERRLREYVGANRLGDRVELVGRLPHERLREEYLAADVLLLPSVPRNTWREVQGCVMQEAMLTRTPVCVSRTGGVLESIAPEMVPFSFEPESSEQIAAALRRLGDLPLRELAELGRRGRAFAEERYDIRRLNRTLLDTVDDLATRAR